MIEVLSFISLVCSVSRQVKITLMLKVFVKVNPSFNRDLAYGTTIVFWGDLVVGQTLPSWRRVCFMVFPYVPGSVACLKIVERQILIRHPGICGL